MKANRKFVQADDAVSPVIAVILMVAITVVLAATVFVLVSDIGSNTGKTAPALQLRVDEAGDKLLLDSAAQGADWNRLAARLKAAEATTINMGQVATPWHNEAALTTGADLSATADTEVTGTDDAMNANDYLAFCGTAAATDVVVQIVDTTANQNIGEYTFLSVAICTA